MFKLFVCKQYGVAKVKINNIIVLQTEVLFSRPVLNVWNSNAQHHQSCEVTWRYARSCYDVAMLKGKSGDDDGKKGLLYQGNHDNNSNQLIPRVEVERPGTLLKKL